MTHIYPLLINGSWVSGEGRKTEPVINPATEETVGQVTHTTAADLDRALTAMADGADTWRRTSAFDRSKLLRRTADLIRRDGEELAHMITVEQGKPLFESRGEVTNSADMLDWFAEEARRAYGRLIPPRDPQFQQMVFRVPVGPVAALCAWNAPVMTPSRKMAPALAAGCPVIVKGSEETPGATVALFRLFEEAGVPPGVINLVFGDPPMISDHLLTSPVIRKVTFTGSVPVGKMLAAKAGANMKQMTMELGGHSPVLVFEDTDVDAVAAAAVKAKFRNAGQICFSPTRFYVQDAVFGDFTSAFTEKANALQIGNGLDDNTEMGPLTNARRLESIRDMVTDAEQRGISVATGGKRHGNKGYFWEPTILLDAGDDAVVSNDEPFAPIAIVNRFSDRNEAISKANRLPYGLAAYAFTRSIDNSAAVMDGIESGTMAINHFQVTIPETPFGGVKDSGIGREGGSEGLEPFLVSKFVSQIPA